jgi:hypothetical protein
MDRIEKQAASAPKSAALVRAERPTPPGGASPEPGEKPHSDVITPTWAEQVPSDEWAVYDAVIDAVEKSGVPFMVGGGFAFSTLAHRWRNTKDLDFFIREQDRETVIRVVNGLGFEDYFDDKPYDRAWIYRGYKDGLIIDSIWQFANKRAQVDDGFLEHAPWVNVHGRTFRILSPEDLCWAKLYVFQRERFDWPDLLNVLDVQAAMMDWDYLLERLGEDRPLLGGLLSVFGWMRPEQALAVPAQVWQACGVRQPRATRNDPHRVVLLDSRDWFGEQQDT